MRLCCSDKCLNQYKMNLFCRETAAHLEMHPHPAATPAPGKPLITPDLWMKDCGEGPGSPVDGDPGADQDHDEQVHGEHVDDDDDRVSPRPSSISPPPRTRTPAGQGAGASTATASATSSSASAGDAPPAHSASKGRR